MEVRKHGEKEQMSSEAKNELNIILVTMIIGLIFFGVIFLIGYLLK